MEIPSIALVILVLLALLNAGAVGYYLFSIGT